MTAPPRVEAVTSCPLNNCDGSGWLDDGPNAERCACREFNARRRVMRHIPRRYRSLGFDAPPLSNFESDPQHTQILAVVRTYCGDIGAKIRDGHGLWLAGDIGTGKSTLAMMVSMAAAKAGCSIEVHSTPRLLAGIRATFDDEGETYSTFFDRLVECDLLHLEDLGAEKRSDWVLEQLYAIVDERYVHKRPLVITTNLDRVSLEAEVGARTVSRLVEICGLPLPIFGADQR